MELDERPVSEMTDEEIITRIQGLRDRRAQARERRIQDTKVGADARKKSEKKVDEVGGDLGNLLDDIFASEEGT